MVVVVVGKQGKQLVHLLGQPLATPLLVFSETPRKHLKTAGNLQRKAAARNALQHMFGHRGSLLRLVSCTLRVFLSIVSSAQNVVYLQRISTNE